MASAKRASSRQEPALERAAVQLLDLARSRIPAPSVYLYTVGDIADSDRPWQNPDPSTESRIWRDSHAIKPERMADTLRTLLTPAKRDIYSTSYLLELVRAAAVAIGVSLIGHRDHQRAVVEARQHVEQLIDRLSTADERWDVILPILNLRLATRQSEIRIGPVRLIRDELGEYVIDGRDTAQLGEFGQWAVKSFDLASDERRANWQRSFQEVSCFAKVEGIAGDQRAALERAKQDIDMALAILRVSYYLYGSYFDRERYGTFGGHYDPTQRFDVMGSETGGLRIALAIPAHPSQLLTDQRITDYLERTDIRLPVDISDDELGRRWPILEQLAELSWARDGRWTELVTAVRWFAEATNAATREDAFLKAAIALDLLLGRAEAGYSETQTTRIGERLGFLLGENDPARRWRIAQALKPLYSTRSGIVHGTTQVAEHDLYRMENISRLAILRMGWEIRHRQHRDLNAFIEWVRKLKFGTPFEVIDVPPFLQLADSWFGENS